MTRRMVDLATGLAVAILAAACNQPPSAPPSDGPAFQNDPVQEAAATSCVFSGNPSLSNASNAYFTLSADRRAASDIIALMQSAFGSNQNYAAARDQGYNLLTLVGKASRAGTGNSPTAGATLVQQAIQCMFNVQAESSGNFAGWPTSTQFDFASALTPTAGGAFFVRGGTGDPAGTIIANDVARIPVGGAAVDGNVSGMAPGNGATWPAMLGTRTLIYGQPVTNGFDWKLIPRDVVFDPFALIALCAAARPGQEYETSEMVAQNSVGVIAYKDADAVCQTPVPVATIQGTGAFALVRRLASYADQLLTPAPLQAAVATRSIGGSASGAKGDEFTVQDLQTVKLTVTENPPASVKVNTGRFGLTINVSTPPDPAGGIEVRLSATNNNGTPTQLLQGSSTPGAGCTAAAGATPVAPKVTLGTVGTDGTRQLTNVSWSNLCVSKTGALTVIATAGAVDRTGGAGTVNTRKFNVKP